MVTYAEVESLVKALEFSAETPRKCLEALKTIECRIMDEGSDNPMLLAAVRKMQNHCVTEVLDARREMLDWLKKNFDRIQKRKLEAQRNKERGAINMFENIS